MRKHTQKLSHMFQDTLAGRRLNQTEPSSLTPKPMLLYTTTLRHLSGVAQREDWLEENNDGALKASGWKQRDAGQTTTPHYPIAAAWLCPRTLQRPGRAPTPWPPGSAAGGLLDILADLPLQALPPLLQLLDGALLGELVRGAAELTLSQGAAEQLLVGGKEGSAWPSHQGPGMQGGHRGWGYLGSPRDQGTAKYKVRGQLRWRGAGSGDQAWRQRRGWVGETQGVVPSDTSAISLHLPSMDVRRSSGKCLRQGAGPGRDRADCSGGAPSPPRASVETVMRGQRVEGRAEVHWKPWGSALPKASPRERPAPLRGCSVSLPVPLTCSLGTPQPIPGSGVGLRVAPTTNGLIHPRNKNLNPGLGATPSGRETTSK